MNPSLWEIVWTFMQIGIVSFGGGYASVSLVEKQIVTIRHWMSYQEFADIVTIDELTPGPVAINAATFVGIRMAGIPGAIAATIGTILPSCLITLLLAYLYKKYRDLTLVNGAVSGLRSMVVALIASTTLSILLNAFFAERVLSLSTIDPIAIILCVIALFILRRYRFNPILVMLGCGLIGLLIYPFI